MILMIHSWSMRRLHHCSPKTVAGGVLDCSASLASCFFLQFDWGVSGFGGSPINPEIGDTDRCAFSTTNMIRFRLCSQYSTRTASLPATSCGHGDNEDHKNHQLWW
jgi:hypothetical protein